MDLVPISSLAADKTYLLPHRPVGYRAGRIVRQGIGSTIVHQPNQDGDGWENDFAIASGTLVVPCDNDEEYHSQGFGKGGAGGRLKNKSTIRKPVEVVWDLCDDIIGRGRTVTKEDRDKVVAEAVEQGVNKSTALTQFYHWRKKHAA